MPTVKLTGVTIKNLRPTSSGQRVNYFDSQHKGLCLRVGSRDMTWTYHYRFNGKSRSPALGKYALGRTDHIDRTAAISAATDIDKLVEKGLDPKISSPPAKPKPSTGNPNTFEKRVKEFLEFYKISGARRKRPVKPKTYFHAKSLLTRDHVSDLVNTDVRNISRVDIVNLLDRMTDTPFQANRLHTYLNIFFKWCWDKGHVDISPTMSLDKRFPEPSRKRVLSLDEIEKFWHGCESIGYPLGDFCRLALATGQRPGECRRLNRNDIHDGIWLIEGGNPKNDERHRIPLPKIAQNIIGKAPKLAGPFIFSATDGKNPCPQGGKTYNEIYEAVGLSEPWRPADLRRTFQTHGSEELDIEPYLLGVICNQISVSKPGVAKVYNQAKWIRQKSEVLEAWNDWLLELVDDEKYQNKV